MNKKVNYLGLLGLLAIGFSIYGVITLNFIYLIAGIIYLSLWYVYSDILKLDSEIFVVTKSKNLWLLTIFIIIGSLLLLVSTNLRNYQTSYIILNGNVYRATESIDMDYYLDIYDILFKERVGGNVIHIEKHLGNLEDLISNPKKEYMNKFSKLEEETKQSLKNFKKCADLLTYETYREYLECDSTSPTYDVIYIPGKGSVDKFLPKSNQKVRKILKEIFKEEPNNFSVRSFEIYKNFKNYNSGDGLHIRGSGAVFLHLYLGTDWSLPVEIERTSFADYLK